MPINEPNPDSSYTLDNGDVLNIQLIGQINTENTFIVNGNGSVNLPEVGQINVAGLTLDEASSIIKAKVNSVLIGTDAYINLSEIRDVNVLISGNAKNPGVYTLKFKYITCTNNGRRSQ